MTEMRTDTVQHSALHCLLAIPLLFCLAGCQTSDQKRQSVADDSDKPNIIYIMADDLGYGELGAYGQTRIETPNIDELAQSGMKFTQHYAGSPVCAPSRYVLMTGKHSGNAYIRRNDAVPGRGDVWDFHAMFEDPSLEGNRPITAGTITVATILKAAGYATGAIGKWGLGGPTIGGHPNDHGFDFFYGYMCQRQAHTYYPSHLWRNDERVVLRNELVDPHQPLPDNLDPYDSASYSTFQDQPDYSATLMHAEALQFIEDHRDRPFFLYLPTPIPHVSLQAPERWVNHYVEKFGDEEPYHRGGSGDLHYTPVRFPKATYAAMISYLDDQVGDIVDKLKELDIHENTLIVFTSDNGPVDGFGVDPEYFDSGGPFPATSGRGKGNLHEAGIRVPMIASWQDRIPPGSESSHISAFWDVMPTLAEIAGVLPPEGTDGISFLPVLTGNGSKQEQHEYLYWEYPAGGGQQAVRMGNWKGLRKNIAAGRETDIELYRLDSDLTENNNVAEENRDVVEAIKSIMSAEHSRPQLAGHGLEYSAD